ncbi:MAG: hypothetical protein WCL06_03715 [Bacteroidota bacterium]
MKPSKLILLLPMLSLALGVLIFSSCKKKFDTGITGKVTIGQGDCMPVVDESTRTYDDYKGYIYCIVKADLDSLHGGDFEQLKQNSIKEKIRGGNLSMELPPNTYVLMPEEVYKYSPENTITITQGQVLQQDFKFWICTSY